MIGPVHEVGGGWWQQEADTVTERCVSLERSLREKLDQVGLGGKVRGGCQGQVQGVGSGLLTKKSTRTVYV